MRRSERGQAAGIESVPFGILVFVAGLILVVNVWAVIDTRAAVDTAARDYLRAYTASDDLPSATARGRAAANASVSARSGAADRLVIHDPREPFGPCRPATVELEFEVPAIRAPFIGSIGMTTVSTTQTELVQPYGDARDPVGLTSSTVCDG